MSVELFLLLVLCILALANVVALICNPPQLVRSPPRSMTSAALRAVNLAERILEDLRKAEQENTRLVLVIEYLQSVREAQSEHIEELERMNDEFEGLNDDHMVEPRGG